MTPTMIDRQEGYGEFANSIPSDMIAYDYLDTLVATNLPEGDAKSTVLEFGCHEGDRAYQLHSKGYDVIGVDKEAQSVSRASERHPQTTFHHVPADEPLPLEAKVDAAYMTFVHPTISDKDELLKTFEKIHDALRPEAPLALLGLHPDSHGGDFLFYDHDAPDAYADGAPFTNRLSLPGGETIEFTDHYWEPDTLADLLEDSGFTNISQIPLRKGEYDELDTIIATAEKRYNVGTHEWTVPLYLGLYAEST